MPETMPKITRRGRRGVRASALAPLILLGSLSACGINPVAPVGTAAKVAGTAVVTTAKVAGTVVKTTADVATAPVRAFNAPLVSVANPLTASEAQCRRDLERMKVAFTAVSPVEGPGQCGIANPVKVSKLSRRITLSPPATLNCEAALAAAKWAHRELAPAARRRYASNVRRVRHMSAYSCRRIRGTGRLSEHGKGNALDVGAIELGNGRVIKVRRKGFFAFREKSFMRAIRKGACEHFNTVLGPGSDADHADHFHFDLRARKSGRKYCDL